MRYSLYGQHKINIHMWVYVWVWYVQYDKSTGVYLFFGVFLHAVNAVYNVMYNYTYIHVCFIPGGIHD